MKKILSLILVSVMLLTSVQTAVFAAIVKEDSVSTYDEPTPEMMEQMIKKVRPLIDVPEEFTEFNWDFRGGSSISNPYWSFYWTDNNTGEVSVTCDAVGRITGYNVYSYGKKITAALPAVSAEELRPIAEQFIEKTAPHLKDLDLRLEDTSFPSVYYNHCYTYLFTRYENNIPVPQNTVSVSVNHITKEVESMNTSINLDTSFEKIDNPITEDKAKEILGEKQEMKLSYRLKTEYDDEGNVTKRLAYLVYTPALSYVSVDAKDGKVYTERNTWQALKAPTVNGGIMMDSVSKEESAEGSANREYQLTEKELEQLEILASLISKDEATKVILENDDLYIHEAAYVSSAYLSKSYSRPQPLGANGEKQDSYVWNLRLMMPGEAYLGMNAVVDAHNGELISYSADLPNEYHYEQYGIEKPELKISKEKAVEIAANFIKEQQPEKYNNVTYSNSNGYATLEYKELENGSYNPIYRAERLTFVRQNEGLDFDYNNFSIGVDLATGKITRYYYTWYDDVVFESPKDAVGSKKAFDALYGADDFGANYEINTNYTYLEGVNNSVNTEIYSRVVYSLYNPVTTTIRALDAKPVDYNGDEITGEKFTGIYSDTDGHWAKQTIERFARIGYGPAGDLFRPNDYITGEDFIRLCETIRIYGDSEEILKLESLSRMEAVKLIIDYLGYGKIATLKNVFITDFADNADFLPQDIGYAAIARGFGLIEGDGENFRPYDTLTRAEAVTIAENVIELGLLN